MTKRLVRTYEPTIVYGEQRFAANIISVQKQLLAFGELQPVRGKALKFGTPIHTLLIHVAGGQTLFELNGQGNTRDARDVEYLEITPTTFRIVFAEGRGPFSGRVSLSPKIEIFDRDAHEPMQLRSVLVDMTPTKSQLARIETLFPRDMSDLEAAATTDRTPVAKKAKATASRSQKRRAAPKARARGPRKTRR
jgi:hypothetical protein